MKKKIVSKTVSIELELSLQELADITAAMGNSSTGGRWDCGFVAKEHQTQSAAPTTYGELKDIYDELVEEGAYGNE